MPEPELDPRRQEKAKEYARLRRYLFFIDLALGAAFLLIVLFSGLSSGLRNLLDLPLPARVALYLTVLVIAYGVITLPLNIYSSFVLPHRYSLSRQNFRAWILEELKSLLVGLTLGMALGVTIYLLLDAFPDTWWLLAFALVALVSVVLTRLAPVLILPLFFKVVPLSDTELRERLFRLAERSQTRIKDVFQINFSSKTSAGNAMLAGWGGTRRIILSDTMLQRYTPDEIEVVMAHELGHHRHGDIPRLILLQSALMLLGFYLVNVVLRWAVPALGMDGISDVAAFPLFVLVLAAFTLMLSPLANAYSRRMEETADRYALAATANPGAFVSMLTKLTDQNLSESQPGKWEEILFYDHPTYPRRMELARRYREETES
jgi:STE24 endopeptidase